jgi:hypothetical protein
MADKHHEEHHEGHGHYKPQFYRLENEEKERIT